MRRREAAGVALGMLVVVAAYAWSAHFWIDLVDEGYFLDLSAPVLDGQLPYRDFTLLSRGGRVQALPGARAGRRRVLSALRALCSATNKTPSATGSTEMQTVGSSVLPPPPLPISFARIPTLASTSVRADRSISPYVSD
jgi:hypothetical protein